MNYTSGDAARLLGVKKHVLRYWTGEMPLVQPAKNLAGHLIYSGRDLRILLRLKHLLYTRRFSIENARTQLEKELADSQDLRADIDGIRSQLIKLLLERNLFNN